MCSKCCTFHNLNSRAYFPIFNAAGHEAEVAAEKLITASGTKFGTSATMSAQRSIKMVVIGDGAVGKTSMLMAFKENK